jgi:hypothetical protein
VLKQYGHTCEARTLEGKTLVSSNAALKLLRARFRATSVFAGAGWVPKLAIAFGDSREGSGARTTKDAAGNDAGALLGIH